MSVYYVLVIILDSRNIRILSRGPALNNIYWGKKAHVTVVPFLRLDDAVYPLKEEVWMSESTVVYLKKKALTNVVYLNYIAWG